MENKQIKNFLLTGEPRVGKTTIIESIVGAFKKEAGGFITREIREKGVRQGFQIFTLDGSTALLAHVSIKSPVKVGKYGVEVKAFEDLALPAMRTALEQKRMVIIDEIGKMELASQKFCQTVLDALGSDPIVLATIHAHRHPFTDALKARSDVRIFHVTVENREKLKGVLVKAIKEAFSLRLG